MRFALHLGKERPGAKETVVRMAAAQRHAPECTIVLVPFTLGWLSVVGRPEESASDLLLRQGADGSFVVFTGLPFVLSSGGTAARPTLEHAVAAFFAGAGASQLAASLEGAFVAVCWDASKQELSIASDFMGLAPLYTASHSGSTFYASSLRAIAASSASPPHPDPTGWGCTLLFGHPIGHRTALLGATRLRPAVVRIHDAHGNVREAQRWALPAVDTQRLDRDLVVEVGEALKDDVRALSALRPSAALLFSGGFDSRMILCMLRHEQRTPRLLVQSHPDENGDADATFADAFARSLGMPVRRFAADPAFFGSEHYLAYTERSELTVPSLRLFIASVMPIVMRERQGLWEGVMLGPAFKFGYAAGGFATYLREMQQMRSLSREAARRLFSPAWMTQLEEGLESTLSSEITSYSNDLEGVWRFSVMNRSRFRTGGNPFSVYDSVTPPLTPGISRRFWELVARIEPSARFGQKFYGMLFRQLAPDGLRLPVASGSDLHRGQTGHAMYWSRRLFGTLQTQFRRRPRLARLLEKAGLPRPFSWQRSALVSHALAEADLTDRCLNADWVRRRQRGLAVTPIDDAAEEMLFYWARWHAIMKGGSASATVSSTEARLPQVPPETRPVA